MGDTLKVLVFIVSLLGAGVGVYAGITVVGILRRRFEGVTPAMAREELDALHSRVAAAEALEVRVTELEERLDFAERLLARQPEPDALPSALREQH
jgi:hypothetical protein